MKRRALRKDFYMEIRRSTGRFLSIFFIVAIGCAFFSGIRSTEPDMRNSGDAYFDKNQLMDFKVQSTMGLTEEDLDAVEKLDMVALAEGGYSADVLCSEGDNQLTVHVMSFLPTMNQVHLEEGRMPQGIDECVADPLLLQKTSLKVGDQIQVRSGTEDPVTDKLKMDTFTIVGAVSSPCYLSFQRGSTTIGNGTVNGFVCVQEEAFALDVYTEIYGQVKGARERTAFTEEYESQVQKGMDQVEAIKEERQTARLEGIRKDAEKELEDARQELADAKRKLEEESSKAEEELSKSKKELDQAEKKLKDAEQEIRRKEQELADARKVLEQKQQEIDASYRQLNEQIDQLNQEIERLNQVRAQYNSLVMSGKKDPETLGRIQAMGQQIDETDVRIAAAKEQIEAGRLALSQGQQQLQEGFSQAEEGEKELEDAEKELEKGKKELEDGKASYEEGKAEAKKKIQDGKDQIDDAAQELEDAERELEELEEPVWYVDDRNTLPDYASYGDNADRMKAIGEVFPVLFFLVAALISLTTMTRMVEEHRTQIGTLKALGYGKGAIAAKYLGYAALATVSGSVFGILIGEKILPYIIITAYRIMYIYVDEIVIPYNLYYGLLSALAALLCTLGATYISCVKELREQAAELMRPPAPKQGKRVFLERVGFLWKRLNFTWKATIRNLVRYKKRFFMTIFGIGGCMALLLVGFGLKDSIFAIAVLQYEEIQLYDGNIILEEDVTQEQREAVMRNLGNMANVDGAAASLLSQVTIGNGEKWKDVYLNVPERTETYSDFVVLQDRVTKTSYKLDDEGAILTEKMAKELGIEAGGELTIRDEEKGDRKVKVKEICENYMGHYLYLTAGLYEKLYQETPAYNSIYYRTTDRITSEAQEIGEKILQMPGTLSVSYTTDLKAQVEDMLESLDIVIIVLIISAGMLAFVVLYNLNNINITERKRELATLKVLGFYSGEISAYVYRENILLTLFGALFGMLLGKILHGFIIETVEIDSVMFGRNIDGSSFVYGVLLTLAFSFFVNGVMYFKLKRINMVESLKSVE